MDTHADAPQFWIVLVGLGLFLGGLVCLVVDWRRERKGHVKPSLPPWHTGWVEFGIFFWFLLTLPMLVQTLAGSLFQRSGFSESAEPEPWMLVYAGYSLHVCMLMLVALGFRLYPGAFNLSLNSYRRSFAAIVAGGVFAFLAAIPLVALTAFGWTSFLQFLVHLGVPLDLQAQDMVRMLAQLDDYLPLILLVVLAVVVAPISEELVFRGLIYRYLKGKMPYLSAMAVSSLMFALIHANVLSFLPLFLLGMLLCRSYERSGNLWVPILFHACFNLNTTLFLFAGIG